MAIPTVFAPIKSGDFTLTPVTVHKQFSVTSASFANTSSGYLFLDAIYSGEHVPIGSDVSSDLVNSSDNSYQSVVWKSIDHLYYRDPYNTFATFEHANRRITHKFLNYSASIISIPYMDFGESIKPGSVEITGSGNINLSDDGNGNLYHSGFATSSYPNSYSVVGYWGFNDEFRNFKSPYGVVSKGSIKYESRVFEPDEKSGAKNIILEKNLTGGGMQATLNGQSYILTHNRNEFNPDASDKLTFSFFVKANYSQSNSTTAYNSIISKRGVIRKQTFGVNQKYVGDHMMDVKHVSSSIEDNESPIFPYDIELINSTGGAAAAGKLRVRRSNGITTTELTSSVKVTNNVMTHVCVVMNTGSVSIFVNGASAGTKTFGNAGDTHNEHSIMFGALNRHYSQGLSGSLDEITIFNEALTSAHVSVLRNTYSKFRTPVVGNIFYRQGIIVLSPLYNLNTIISKTPTVQWSMRYKGTHTVYQYESLCRVKKGSFNLTYNPTARQSFKSDLLINDMTGSVMMPYATTIGLYNDQGDLVAVGKLGQAVAMRDDVDINFLVRWDA